MNFHNYLTFLNDAVNAWQAKKMAWRANQELREQVTCLYGRYENGEWHSLSSFQKPGDTHKMLGIMGAHMSIGKINSGNE